MEDCVPAPSRPVNRRTARRGSGGPRGPADEGSPPPAASWRRGPRGTHRAHRCRARAARARPRRACRPVRRAARRCRAPGRPGSWQGFELVADEISAALEPNLEGVLLALVEADVVPAGVRHRVQADVAHGEPGINGQGQRRRDERLPKIRARPLMVTDRRRWLIRICGVGNTVARPRRIRSRRCSREDPDEATPSPCASCSISGCGSAKRSAGFDTPPLCS